MFHNQEWKIQKNFQLKKMKNRKRTFLKNFRINDAIFAKILEKFCKKCSVLINLANIAILLQTCMIFVRNAKFVRISEEFCKICDSFNLGLEQNNLENLYSLMHSPMDCSCFLRFNRDDSNFL